MKLLEQMNSALDYIELNIKNPLDKKELIKKSCISEFEFYRIFSLLSGVTLGEYIRRRRLSEAAFDIQISGKKIIDIALEYGYESPESFSRAFQKLHGVSPSKARCQGILLKSYPRITFNISIKGDVAMNYKIESKKSFKIFGIEKVFSVENEKNLQDIPNFWSEIMDNGEYEKLNSLGWNNGIENLGNVNALCCSYELPGAKFPYMIFTFSKDNIVPHGYKSLVVPEATWAIFKTEVHSIDDTPKVLQSLIKRIYSEWLPNNEYEKIPGYELEFYYGSGDKCYCETWIRIKK